MAKFDCQTPLDNIFLNLKPLIICIYAFKVYKAHHTHSSYTSAPPGFNSVKGNGSQIPTWKQNASYHGAVLPCGVTTQNLRHSQFDLPWNEYIVYDPNRIIVRFLVECTF